MKGTGLIYFIIASLLISINAMAMLGVEKGEKAPEITLTDTQGKTFKLSEQKDKTVLVFYRGSWCPYCIKQLKSLQTELVKPLKENGAQIVAISVDRPKVARKMKRNFDFSFTVLSDPKATSLKAYNIVNKLDDSLVKKYKNSYKIDVEGDSGETHHMVAHPAVFVVEDMKVTFSDVHTDYKQRTSNQQILQAIK